MDNKRFSRILYRYHAGVATDAEKALVEQWYDLLNEEKSMVLSDQEEEAMEDRVWVRLSQQIQPEGREAQRSKLVVLRSKWVTPLAVLAAATVVGLVFWLGGFFPSSPDESLTKEVSVSKADFRTIRNETSGTKVLQLSDKSLVRLTPGAILKVPEVFHPKRREVILEGEAFFEITKNPAQPFMVYSGRVTTQVLGTSFNIKPLADGEQLEVVVRTGKVQVFVFETFPNQQGKNKLHTTGVVLTPNQRAVYHQQTGFFEATLAQSPQPLEPEDLESAVTTEFRFAETPLHEVVRLLANAYGIEIILDPALRDCPFSGDISRRNLFEKLDIINVALGTSYDVKGTRILIRGNGCE